MDGGASRVVACARLSLAREQERRRAIQEPLVVPWRETRARDGQVVISLCSSDDDDDDGGEEEEEEEKEEEDRDDAYDYDAGQSRGGSARSFAYAAGPVIKQELTHGGGNMLDVMNARRDHYVDTDAIVGGRDVGMDAGESSESDAVDIDLTGDTDDYEGGESDHERVKPEATAGFHSDDDQWTSRPEAMDDSSRVGHALLSAAVMTAADRPLAVQHRRSAAASASEWCVRKMDEVDAAFLLFYGVRETPSASVLRMIIGALRRSVRLSLSPPVADASSPIVV